MLSLDWGVCSRADLLSQVHWLITSGHRTSFDAERARWVDTSLAEAERHELRETAASSSDAAETLWRLERMLNNDRDIRNVDFSAWDLVRAAMLTRCGFALGWLTEEETWDTLAILDQGLRERYRSWTQVSESFRLARWYWNSTSGMDEHFNDLHDLNRSLVLLSPDGPWGLIDWDVETPEPSFLILDDLLDHTNLVMLDLKQIDPEIHKVLVGIPNTKTLKFARYLAERKQPARVRYVVVPGYTDDDRSAHLLGEFIADKDNVEIGANCVIKNAKIGANSKTMKVIDCVTIVRSSAGPQSASINPNTAITT